MGTRLRELPGVAEAEVITAEGVAYLKVDRERLDPAVLKRFAATESSG